MERLQRRTSERDPDDCARARRPYRLARCRTMSADLPDTLEGRIRQLRDEERRLERELDALRRADSDRDPNGLNNDIGRVAGDLPLAPPPGAPGSRRV